MTDTTEYTPPKVWVAKPALGRFANINRPTAGAQYEKELPVGRHPLQLYSLARRTASRSRSCSKSCWPGATRARSTTPG